MARSRFNKRAAARSGAQARRMGAARIAAAGRASDRGANVRRGNGFSIANEVRRGNESRARQGAASAGRGFTSGPKGGMTRNQRNVRRQVERAIGEGASH